ncbi:MAG: ABC transporter ATP-binding protein [Clostridiales bacterium]|nr:ABC transporter ATP-binding protein [Clostridiales bacterium]
MSMLEVKDLHVHYETDAGVVKAVNGVSFTLEKGETLGLVGETGAGKTTTALALLRLVPDPPGKIVSGDILLEGKELLKLKTSEMRKLRGEKLAMIFQDPMTALNPVMTVGDQIAEVIRLHNRGLSKAQLAIKAAEMLETVGIPADRCNEYPHQFSGGMKQRVVIAIALACNPDILIADEPTTALDVTIQAQVLDLIRELKNQRQTSVILITHDLGVVAEICDKVAIMYAGEIVEIGTLEQVYRNPVHSYTKGLFNSLPDLHKNVHRLQPIRGLMPDPMALPEGCNFADRCDLCDASCRESKPHVVEVEPGHLVKCKKC